MSIFLKNMPTNLRLSYYIKNSDPLFLIMREMVLYLVYGRIVL